MKFELGKVHSNPYARAFKPQQVVEADGDHEVKMAEGQLEYIIKSATELKGKLGGIEKNIPGWIQDHISKAHSYLHQANSGYHELGDKISVNESKHPHLKTNVKTDSDYSKVASILKSNKINYAWSAESGTLIFRDRFDMMKAEDLLGKNWLKENVNEATTLQKIFRKIGWGGDGWTPQDYAKQIKDLPDSTLKLWYDSAKNNKGIPNTPLAFQQKLTKIEMEKRGLIESTKLKYAANLVESKKNLYKKGDIVNYIPKLSGFNPKTKLKISNVVYAKGDEFTKPGWYYTFDGTNLRANEKDIKSVSSIKESTEEPKIITQLNNMIKLTQILESVADIKDFRNKETDGWNDTMIKLVLMRKIEGKTAVYRLEKDNWFRRFWHPGKGYGIMIRDIKISNTPLKVSSSWAWGPDQVVLNAVIKYLPNEFDRPEDDIPQNYETVKGFIILGTKNFTGFEMMQTLNPKDIERFVKFHSKEYKP